MIFLVSTTQRCGSTWLVRMLEAMTGSAACYVNGLEIGFRLRGSSDAGAVMALGKMLRAARGGRVFMCRAATSMRCVRNCRNCAC